MLRSDIKVKSPSGDVFQHADFVLWAYGARAIPGRLCISSSRTNSPCCRFFICQDFVIGAAAPQLFGHSGSYEISSACNNISHFCSDRTGTEG